jgi:hypothetical protein
MMLSTKVSMIVIYDHTNECNLSAWPLLYFH